MAEQVDDFLAHYGVKGMRWGKRKSDSTPTAKVKVSKEDKEAAKKAFKAYSDPIIEKRVDQWINSSMSKATYESLSTKDVHFQKGQDFFRVSSRKDEKLRNLTYVSHLPEDRTRYRVVMPNTAILPKKHYEYEYQAIKDLRSPSEKARVDAFIELMDTPTIKVGKKEITGREVLKRQGFGKDVKSMTSQQLGLKYYSEFAAMQIAKTPLHTAYFESIKQKGYNAVMDDNDRNVVSKSPLIILDPNGVVKRMNVTQLSKQDIVDAKKNIQRVL